MKNTIIKHGNLIAIGYTSVSGEAAVAVNAFSTTLPHAADYYGSVLGGCCSIPPLGSDGDQQECHQAVCIV